MIMYSTFLFISFIVGTILFPAEIIKEFQITCENGEIETFSLEDDFVCGGFNNPLKEELIEVNFSLLVDKFK